MPGNDGYGTPLIADELLTVLPSTHSLNIGRWADGKVIRSSDVISFSEVEDRFLLEARNFQGDYEYEVELVADIPRFGETKVVAQTHMNGIDSVVLTLELFSTHPNLLAKDPQLVINGIDDSTEETRVFSFIPEPDSDHALNYGRWKDNQSLGLQTPDETGEYTIDIFDGGLRPDDLTDRDTPFNISLVEKISEDSQRIHTSSTVRNGSSVLQITDMYMKALYVFVNS